MITSVGTKTFCHRGTGFVKGDYSSVPRKAVPHLAHVAPHGIAHWQETRGTLQTLRETAEESSKPPGNGPRRSGGTCQSSRTSRGSRPASWQQVSGDLELLKPDMPDAGIALNLLPPLDSRNWLIEYHRAAGNLRITPNEGIRHHPAYVVPDDLHMLQFECPPQGGERHPRINLRRRTGKDRVARMNAQRKM